MLSSLQFGLYLIYILLGHATFTSASRGDSSFVHQRCLTACNKIQCKSTTAKEKASEQIVTAFTPYTLSLPERAIVWGCEAECRYHCMWWTIDAFVEDKLGIPQFRGKWPQVRLFGVEEPASALFSLLNLLTQISTLRDFCRSVPYHAPMYFAWIFFSLTGANAWFWSTIFHTYDTDFTERMDYCSAFGYTLGFLLVLLLRMAYRAPTWVKPLIIAAFSFFFFKHISCILSDRISYDHNMQMCIFIGTLTIVGWLVYPAYLFNQRQQRYAQFIQVAVSLIGLFSLFELFDFPAIFWLVDSHAVWHAATIGMPYLIFRFAKEDCQYLLEAVPKHSSS